MKTIFPYFQNDLILSKAAWNLFDFSLRINLKLQQPAMTEFLFKWNIIRKWNILLLVVNELFNCLVF